MNERLTLGEKLKDLRSEKGLTLAEVSGVMGISVSTLQRMEADADVRVGYQDIEVLTRFYDVSADYLFGLTDNRQYNNVEIGQLHLSDEAIAVLKNGKLNNRLISELLSHPDFPRLLIAIEIYIDGKVLPQLRTMNAMYKYTLHTIEENAEVPDGDKLLAFLRESVVDEDDYLLYRISERFSVVMKSMFEAHQKDKAPPEQPDMLSETIETVDTFLALRKTESAEQAKAAIRSKLAGFYTSRLNDEERRVVKKALEYPNTLRRVKKRK